MKGNDSWYKIKCPSVGENILAQKVLFKKGYSWAGGQQDILFPRKGQNLYIKSNHREITRSHIDSEHFADDKSHTQITISELLEI